VRRENIFHRLANRKICKHLNTLVLHGGNLSAREYLVTKTRQRIGAAPGRTDAVRAADVELCVARLASLA